jgi:hypothetical protein
MEKIILGSGQELLNEAIRLQSEFKKSNVFWDLECCLKSVIDNEQTVTNQFAIDSATIIAKSMDIDYRLNNFCLI